MTLNSWFHSLLPLSAEITAHLASFRFSCENIEDIPLKQSAEPTWCNHPLSPPLQISTHQGQGFNTHIWGTATFIPCHSHDWRLPDLKASGRLGKSRQGSWLDWSHPGGFRSEDQNTDLHWTLPLWHCRELTSRWNFPSQSFPHYKSPSLAAPWVQSFSPRETDILSRLKAICFWGGWLNLSFISTSPPSVPG